MMTKFSFLPILGLAVISLSLCVNSVHAGTDPHTVAAWTFDEGPGDTAKDISGNGHDGELFSGAKRSEGGKIGGCIEFDGVESYIEIPHTDDLNLEAFTIEAWVNCQPGANQAIMHKQGAGGGSERNYILNIRPEGFLRGSFSNAGSQYSFDGPTLLKANEWYHVAATYDGAVGRIYINGELDAETRLDLPLEPNDAPLLIGKAGGTGGGRFLGLIDEVRLSNVARTQDEIRELMNNGLALVLAVSAESGLVTTWGFVRSTILDF